jgi:hypothetical protein
VCEKHVDGLVDERDPSLTTGIVGDLLTGEAEVDGRPEIDGGLVGDTEPGQVGEEMAI